MFQSVLKWHDGQTDIVGASVKLNADCIIHATLEDDKVNLKLLYSFGYRLGPDTDRRINKVIFFRMAEMSSLLRIYILNINNKPLIAGLPETNKAV